MDCAGELALTGGYERWVRGRGSLTIVREALASVGESLLEGDVVMPRKKKNIWRRSKLDVVVPGAAIGGVKCSVGGRGFARGGCWNDCS